jgi:hypothetical protein
MKKTGLLALCLISVTLLFGQMTKKELKKEIKAKASKEAKKEAKKYRKIGWDVAPGSLSLEKMFQVSFERQLDRDEKGNPIYIFADGNQVAESKTAGEMAALEFAKLSLAGLIQTNVSSLVSANIANAQLSREEAASTGDIVQSAKNMIAVELGYIDPSFKIYRNVGAKNIEVQVRVFYDRRQAMDIAKKIVRKELKEKLKLNEEKLEKIMGIAD